MPRILSKGLRWAVNEENLDDVPQTPGVYALHYYRKRRYVGKSKNLRRRLKQHYRENVAFTEFTWYETAPNDRHDLESDLIDREFEELWNETHGSRTRTTRKKRTTKGKKTDLSLDDSIHELVFGKEKKKRKKKSDEWSFF